MKASSVAVFVGALALLAAFPMFPAPWPALSLGATLGKVLYASLLVVFVVGYIAAETQANALREREQEERDQLSEARHSEEMAASARIEALVAPEVQKLSDLLVSMAASVSRGVPPASPQMQELIESAKSSAATIKGIVVTPGAGELRFTGYAPEIVISESKAGLGMPKVKSTGAHQP